MNFTYFDSYEAARAAYRDWASGIRSDWQVCELSSIRTIRRESIAPIHRQDTESERARLACFGPVLQAPEGVRFEASTALAKGNFARDGESDITHTTYFLCAWPA